MFAQFRIQNVTCLNSSGSTLGEKLSILYLSMSPGEERACFALSRVRVKFVFVATTPCFYLFSLLGIFFSSCPQQHQNLFSTKCTRMHKLSNKIFFFYFTRFHSQSKLLLSFESHSNFFQNKNERTHIKSKTGG